MSVVDASVWVSRFWPDDAFHRASRDWLIKTTVAGNPIFAPSIMLAEVAGAIARRTGDRQLGYQIGQQILRMPTMQLINVDTSMGQLAAKIASEHKLRGADAIYVATAQRLDVALISWDHEQLARASSIITTTTPAS